MIQNIKRCNISEFLPENQLFLSEYTNNIDKLFIDKVCQDLLVKARNIMKKNLHDSIQYEPQVRTPLLLLEQYLAFFFF